MEIKPIKNVVNRISNLFERFFFYGNRKNVFIENVYIFNGRYIFGFNFTD